MIVSCQEPDRRPQAIPPARVNPGALHWPAHQLCASTTETASAKTQAAEGMPRPDRDEMEFEYGYGLSLGLISSPSPPPGQDTRGCHHRYTHRRGAKVRRRPAEHAPLSPELWHYTAYPERSGSHLGSTLKPGRAVLTLGVSRRSGSVACIRADASPTEVLAGSMLAPRPATRQTFRATDLNRRVQRDMRAALTMTAAVTSRILPATAQAIHTVRGEVNAVTAHLDAVYLGGVDADRTQPLMPIFGRFEPPREE